MFKPGTGTASFMCGKVERRESFKLQLGGPSLYPTLLRFLPSSQYWEYLLERAQKRGALKS